MIKDAKVNTVPMQTRNDEKASSFHHSPLGYKNFHPWFLADANPSANNDYFKVVMQFLEHVDPIIYKEEYCFFRGDVNIVMMWYRVRLTIVLI